MKFNAKGLNMFFSKQPNMEVIIGIESTVLGEVISKGTVRIDGTLEGNVTADCVVIAEKGTILGNATVRRITIGGKIIGAIRATEEVDIQTTGDVQGDICSIRLCITEGGKFEGRSMMLRTKELPYKNSATESNEVAAIS
jgi:cytoskeletal protein CcmA (bactofilin family)